MLYAILYDDCEDVLESWTPERKGCAISELNGVADELSREGRLGPVARMMPTTTGTILLRPEAPRP